MPVTGGGPSNIENYPMDVNTEISIEELRILETAFEKETIHDGQASIDTTFSYSWGLIQSHYNEDRSKGIKLLKELLKRDPIRQLDCYYYLAIAYFKEQNYSESKKYNDKLLEIRPNHPQGLSLQKLIKDKLTHDGLIGMAIVGGAAAILGGIALLLRKK